MNLPGNKIWLWLEWVFIFVALPLVLYWLPVEPMYYLIGFGVLLGVYLVQASSFSNTIFVQWISINWLNQLLLFLSITLILSLLIYYFRHALWLQFPLANTQKYLLSLLLYPLLSVIPQEIIYRAFYYHRYTKIFSNRNIQILTNSFAFGFSHIIYGNWVAPAGAFLISFIFSHVYLKSKSLPVVCLVHYVYGIMIFTIGFGHYFK
ncbi:MAG: type II CAAX prenyl endopeptidase Rce1 family protein [Cyclobacteriaceae bacterium]